jgi:hypothetical protein
MKRSAYCWERVDEDLRPDYSPRFLVRDTRCSDHPAIRGNEKAITIVDFDGRKLWIFAEKGSIGRLCSMADPDSYARARIGSNEPALVYSYDRLDERPLRRPAQ